MAIGMALGKVIRLLWLCALILGQADQGISAVVFVVFLDSMLWHNTSKK